MHLTTEDSAAAAEQLRQIAETQAGTGVTVNLKTTEITCLLPVGSTAVFDVAEGSQIHGVIRLHGNRTADMLQRRNLIAKSVMCQRTEVVPAGIPVGGIAEGIEGFLIATEADVVVGSLLVAVTGRTGLAALLIITLAAESTEGSYWL